MNRNQMIAPKDVNRLHLEIAVPVLFFFPFLNGIYNRFIVNNQNIFWFMDIFTHLIFPVIIFSYLFLKSGLRCSHVGLDIPKTDSGQMKLVAHIILVSFAFYWWERLFNGFLSIYLFNDEKYRALFRMSEPIPDNFIYAFFYTAYLGLTAGFVEELYYRGLLVFLLSQYGVKNVLSILIISTMFSIVHWENGPAAIISTFALGCICTSYFMRYRMLWPLIIAHFVYDWTIFFEYKWFTMKSTGQW